MASTTLPAASASFDPRLREEATEAFGCRPGHVAVSIHASVKRRPSDAWPDPGKYKVSIHASVKRRRTAAEQQEMVRRFRSTPP